MRFPLGLSTLINVLVIPIVARNPEIHHNSTSDKQYAQARALRGRYPLTNELTVLGARDSGLRFEGVRLLTGSNLDACGREYTDLDFVVALNAIQFNSGEHCFETITITIGDKTTTAQIADVCAVCEYAELVLSHGLFTYFAPDYVGILTGAWDFQVNTTPTTTTVAPTPTTTYIESSTTTTTTTTIIYTFSGTSLPSQVQPFPTAAIVVGVIGALALGVLAAILGRWLFLRRLRNRQIGKFSKYNYYYYRSGLDPSDLRIPHPYYVSRFRLQGYFQPVKMSRLQNMSRVAIAPPSYDTLSYESATTTPI